MIEPGKLLSAIDYPDKLRKLDKAALVQVSDELRRFIIDSVSVYGGHFGASLGTVELTVALHYCFNTPIDNLIWDVGHQAYGHKILTGRRDNFHSNRRFGGLAGFPTRSESEYDSFGVGHSSTSISAALGMAVASQIEGDKKRQHIAVIGDGALTGGMAFEALNHAGSTKANLLVILNDNNMSIDPNVGALKDYLTDITTSHAYNKLREDVWRALGKAHRLAPIARDLAARVEHTIKAMLAERANLFESFGMRYFGPVDGHDVAHLVDVLNDLKRIQGPKLLHVRTIKGKGYAPAEKNQTLWHAPGLFDKITGQIHVKANKAPEPPKYQDVFGETIIEIAESNPKVVGITPAMPSGCSLNKMMQVMPHRAFDVGIAEQHAVTFAAGLATQGKVAYCNIYSTFLQRGYDQVIHDVCLQNLDVVLCIDRAGLVGADGATHQGAYDIAFLRCVPNLVVSAPMDEIELRNLMYSAQLRQGPMSIRYPRGKGRHFDWKKPLEAIEIGKGRVLNLGRDLLILSFGTVGNYALDALSHLTENDINPTIVDMRFVKPLDEELLHRLLPTHRAVVTIEDGCLTGGFGSAILEFMAENNYTMPVKRLGIPDRFIEHGEPEMWHNLLGYDAKGITDACVGLTQQLQKNKTQNDLRRIKA